MSATRSPGSTLSLPLLEAGLLDEVLLPEQMAGLAQARPALHLLGGGAHLLPLLWGQTRAAPGFGGRAKGLAHAQLGGSARVPSSSLPINRSAEHPGSSHILAGFGNR